MLQHSVQYNIALARPYFPENIGSSARALAVMGFSNLSVINPNCDPFEDRAVTLASHAAKTVLAHTQIYSSTVDWASTCDFRVGFCLRDRALGPKTCMLPELPGILQNQHYSRVGLLFGCEKSGLDNDELSFCHYVCEIPTSSALDYHSLNLAQAVQVVTYTLLTQMCHSPMTELPMGEEAPSAAALRSLDDYLERLVLSQQMQAFSQRTTSAQTLRRLRMIASQSIRFQSDLNFFYGFLKGFINV